jgi:hypothetical protein
MESSWRGIKRDNQFFGRLSMWLKSHRWVDVPGTRTEKRWATNVRESVHTAMVFDKKYLNVETGKFDTDKLRTLNSLSLIDLVTEETYDYMTYSNWNRYKDRKHKKNKKQEASVYNFPKHVPKDNDFDEELRREKAIKEEQDRQYAEARLREHNKVEAIEREKRRIAYKEFKEKTINEARKSEEEYAKKLAETEARLMKERDERNERLKNNRYLKYTGNVIVNKWIPK